MRPASIDLGTEALPCKPLSSNGARGHIVDSTVKKSSQPLPDDLLGFPHDAVDQLLHRRDIVDQSDHHAAAPSTGIHVTVDHHPGVDTRPLLMDVLDLDPRPLPALDFEQLIDTLVFEHPP